MRAEADFASLKATGSHRAFGDAMFDFDGLNKRIGTDEMLARGKRLDRENH